ncbi:MULTISPECIES: helix-turn-helix domain-containing protein [unclassified Serratia (in: enterobacteria)]|uniref:helix-turn-helix domain-containing protein n=1 Tax=unclassified Serratia (in: enterobacteria) TaxID=2647522 RepID=UPI0030766E0E
MQDSISLVPSWPQTPLGVENFGKRLESVMGNESIASFARECHVSAATVRKYLKAGTLPGIDNILAISEHTGRSLTWLISGEGEEYSDKQSQDANRLSDEEIAKWWCCISDALTSDDKIRVIAAFKQGGLNALFKPDLIIGPLNKPKGR